MNINSCIQEILNKHECVIVPELGGFIASYCSSQIDEKTGIWLPPSKEILFNSQLDKNDGTLTSWVSNKHKISFRKASKAIAAFVDQTKDRLNNGERVYIESVGHLYFSDTHTILFEPALEKNFLLSSFGLNPINVQEIGVRRLLDTIPAKEKEKIRTLFTPQHIRRVAVAIPLLLTLWIAPVKHTSYFSNVSSVMPGITKIEPKQVNETITSIHSVEVSPTSLKDKRAAVLKTLTEERSKHFHIIVGSFKAEENARAYFRQLKREGHSPRLFTLKNGYIRISIDSYETRDEAIFALRELKNNNDDLFGWILQR